MSVFVLEDTKTRTDTGLVQDIPHRHHRRNSHTDGYVHAIFFTSTPTEGAAHPDSEEVSFRREKIR